MVCSVSCLLLAIINSVFLLAPSTAMIYGGKSVGEVCPAFMDKRRLRDAIETEKRKDYPKGMGWEG
jgi:hypothetical protein